MQTTRSTQYFLSRRTWLLRAAAGFNGVPSLR